MKQLYNYIVCVKEAKCLQVIDLIDLQRVFTQPQHRRVNHADLLLLLSAAISGNYCGGCLRTEQGTLL